MSSKYASSILLSFYLTMAIALSLFGFVRTMGFYNTAIFTRYIIPLVFFLGLLLVLMKKADWLKCDLLVLMKKADWLKCDLSFFLLLGIAIYITLVGLLRNNSSYYIVADMATIVAVYKANIAALYAGIICWCCSNFCRILYGCCTIFLYIVKCVTLIRAYGLD